MKKLFCMLLAVVLMLSFCGCSLFSLVMPTREDLPFRLTISADDVLFFETPEGCIDYLREHLQDPYFRGQLGADGSLILTMTEAQRQIILDDCKAEIQGALMQYNDGSKIRIEVTDDCRELHTYSLMTEFPSFGYLDAMVNMRIFSIFCPEDYGEFSLYMHNADTGKVLGSVRFPAGKINVDEKLWADSYVLTAQEARAYTQKAECREWVLFESLTPAIPDSYILLVRSLPKMVTKDYSYFYLDEDHRFHLGLTREQEDKTREKLENFLSSEQSLLKASNVQLEIAPDRRSYRISIPEGDVYGLNYCTVLTAACMLAQRLEAPEETPFVKADIYRGDTYLGTADTENGIPQGILPETLIVGKNN